MAGGDRRHPAIRLRTELRANAILEAKRLGRTNADIAEDVAIWGDEAPVSPSKVDMAYRRALRRITAPERSLARAAQSDRYDALRRELWDVVRGDHVVTNQGVIARTGAWLSISDVRDARGKPVRERPDGGWEMWDDRAGDPLRDSMPKVKALEALLKLEDSYNKLFGLNAPVEVAVEQKTTVTYDFGVPVDWVK